MEQHPVPQNITTFQFRLIGDMTIKQFGYLAGGIILAYISYKLPLPFFFSWPIASVFALAGFGFAFVPIEERPMDIWFYSFIRNVYNPTLFHWEQSPPILEPSPAIVPPPVKIPSFAFPKAGAVVPKKTAPSVAKQPVSQTAAPTQPKPSVASHKPQKIRGVSPLDSFFSWIDNLFEPKPKALPAYVVRPSSTQIPVVPSYSVQPPQTMAYQTDTHITGRKITPPTNTPPQEKDEAGEKKQEQSKPTTSSPVKDLTELKTQIASLQDEIKGKNVAEERILELQKQFSELITQKDAMEKELLSLKSQSKEKNIPPVKTRPAGVVSDSPKEPTIKVMGTDVATRAGLPRLTTFPNVVTGIIKDFDNNLLPGVLVTVKDKESIPLRALKTNKLGQFAASTPLGNGTYVIEVEDPRERFTFDKVQITLNGSVMQALLIVARSKRELEREQLHKQIFGSPNASA